MTIHQTALRAIMFLTVAAVSTAFVACKPKSEGGAQPANNNQTSAADREAIERLHQRDEEASKKWDVDTLTSLWTDDIVALLPDRNPLIGKDANRNFILSAKQESEGSEVVEYKFDFKEVNIVGGWAYEWGTLTVAEKPAGENETVRSNINLMRILRREQDGSWKIARTIFNGSDSGDADRSPAPR